MGKSQDLGVKGEGLWASSIYQQFYLNSECPFKCSVWGALIKFNRIRVGLSSIVGDSLHKH